MATDNLLQRLRDSGKDIDLMHPDALRREARALRAENERLREALIKVGEFLSHHSYSAIGERGKEIVDAAFTRQP